MAKIKLGAIVTDIRGKLGGHVFSKNRGGAYMRTKVTPVNPASARQTFVRAIFAAISSLWSALTDAQRGSFAGLVEAYAKTDIFGDIKIPSGKALHQRLNQNLGVSGQAYITTCLAPIAVASPDVSKTEYAVGTVDLDYTHDTSLVGYKLLVFATPKLSAGTKFVKNKLRILLVQAGDVPGVHSIYDIYAAKYGALVPGDNIYFGYKTVNAQGQISPMQVMKMVQVA